MLNIDNVKLVLFDFDDTLCIHKKTNNYDKKTYNVEMINGNISYWEHCNSTINKQMKTFMNECASKGIEMGLISAVDFACSADNKIKWASEKYGHILKNYCTGSTEAKKRMIGALMDAKRLNPNQILFIDDLYSNINDAVELGVQVAIPMEIVNYINDKEFNRIQ